MIVEDKKCGYATGATMTCAGRGRSDDLPPRIVPSPKVRIWDISCYPGLFQPRALSHNPFGVGQPLREVT